MFVNINGARVYYEVAGQGPAILLLHGWGTSSVTMRPILKFLSDSLAMRAYAMDFPGFGLSDPPSSPWEVADFMAVVLQLLDGLGLDRVDLLGHSFGGRVAIKLATTFPRRVGQMVLVDSAGIRPKRTFGYHARVYSYKTMKRLLGLLPSPARGAIQARLEQRLGSRDYQLAGALRPSMVKVVNEDLTTLLPRIGCQTLLVWGEMDEETPLSDAVLMQQLIPGANLKVIPGAGHFSYLDNPELFKGYLSSFFGAAQ